MFGGCKIKILQEESDNKQNALQLENLEGGWGNQLQGLEGKIADENDGQ
jgi:hypothetical protein